MLFTNEIYIFVCFLKKGPFDVIVILHNASHLIIKYIVHKYKSIVHGLMNLLFVCSINILFFFCAAIINEISVFSILLLSFLFKGIYCIYSVSDKEYFSAAKKSSLFVFAMYKVFCNQIPCV